MGQKHPTLKPDHIAFIERQHMFFVATSAPEARINLSPKGLDSFRVLDEQRAAWLNLTGSGNETAAHLLEDNRMTVMFCAFEGDPRILRLYGTAAILHAGDPDWDTLRSHFPEQPGDRQMIVLEIEMVHTSCGFGVPLYTYVGQREELVRWANKKGAEGIRRYWASQNSVSMDGRPTDLKGEEK